MILDEIELSGLEFYGRHGCLPEERERGQLFVVDAILYLPLQSAGQKDDLNLTINYAEVQQDIKCIVSGESVNLVETVAERIASRLLGKYELLQRVTICVHKPQAPIEGSFRDVQVKITRQKE